MIVSQFLCALILLCATLPALQARTFTSRDGRKVEGEISDATDKEVTIKRAGDGREFKLSLAILSLADQQEVDAWLLANTTKKLSKIVVTATKDKIAFVTQNGGGGNSSATSKEQNWCWVITVKNSSAFPVSGLSLNYIQLVERTDRNQGSVSGKSKNPARYSKGTLAVPDLPPFGSTSVRTEGIVVRA